MKIIDRYILRHFIQNLVFGILCFIIIFVLVDLFENLDKFLDNKVQGDIVFRYYLNFLPEIIKLIAPVGMLLASLFTISRFISYSELVAMKSAGISIYRYILPIFIFGIAITAFSVYFNGWIVPKSNTKKIEIENKYLGKSQQLQQVQNLYFQDKKNKIITISNYDKINKICYQASIFVFKPDNLSELMFRVDAKQMNWNDSKNEWEMVDAYERYFPDTREEKIVHSDMKLLSQIENIKSVTITPDLILKRQIKPEEMNLSDFRQYIDNIRESGLDVSKAEVDYYSIISFPFASLVTILFGVSISSNKRKGGAALQFGISLIVSFIYLGFVKISQVFGYNGDINPVITAWLANVIFLLISLVYLVKNNRL